MWLGSVLAVVVSPALLLASVAVDIVDRRSWRATRLMGLGLAFCVLEVTVLPAAFGLWVWSLVVRDPDRVRAAHQALLRGWLAAITGTINRGLGFSIDARFPETGPAPLVVISRHAGPGDALVLMHELANVQGREVRSIGKRSLLWDPFFDHVAQRAGYLFLGSADATDAVRSASAMGPRGAFITFPEGGNWTARRQAEAIASLRARGDQERAETATRLRHLLLPRAGGVRAALAGSPEATVVFVGHVGHEDLDSLGGLWRAIPEGRRIRIEARIVERPADGDVSRWLLACWSDMDRWIERHSGPGSAE